MSQSIIEQIQPYVSTVVIAIIGLLTTVILGFINSLKNKAHEWFEANTSVKQREIIYQIASEAFSHAEAIYKEQNGKAKMNQAFIYASDKLGQTGIAVSPEEIRAAIEKACLEYNANKVKVVKEAS